MSHFCDNKFCQLHVLTADNPNVTGGGHLTIKFVAHNGTAAESRQWIFRRTDDNKFFTLCTTCANVAAMLNGESKT